MQTQSSPTYAVSPELLAREDFKAACLDRNFREVFRLMRKYDGVSQDRMSSPVEGLTQSRISRIMRDKERITTVDVIERCSGHNGTYAVKKEYRAASVKIARPVVNRVAQAKADHYSSDCPMAGHQIESGLSAGDDGAPREPEHPMTLVRKAYGI